VAKALASRMKILLGALISDTQNILICGRKILDSALIANECLDCRLKADILGLIGKLDLKKTYDQVNWVLAIHVGEMRFKGKNKETWISYYISTV